MPHQCVRCNTFYKDGAEEILKGCECGGKLFFYIRKEKEEIEKDVLNLVGADQKTEKPIVLDLEAIKIKKPGKYVIDLPESFKTHTK